MTDLRIRYELLDLAYYMEDSEHLQRTNASRIITTLYKELELPVLQPNIDAAHAFLVDMFLSGYPIFGVVTDDIEADKAAQQLEAIIEENSVVTGWARHLSLALKDGLKYNLGSINLDWMARKSFNFVTDTEISFQEAVADNIIREGNEITSNDMYNLGFDTSVAPAEVHLYGDFTCSIETKTLVQLHSMVADLMLNDGQVMNVDDQLWRSSIFHNWYYGPNILSNDTVYSGTDWVSFFSSIDAKSNLRRNSVDRYEYNQSKYQNY